VDQIDTTHLVTMDVSSLLVPVVPPPASSSSSSSDGGEHVQSEMRRDRVDDFRQGQQDEENVLRQMIGHSRSYVQPQFNQVEHSRSETNNSCEYVPASNLLRYGQLFAGIPLYLDDRVLITQPMLKQSEQLASLLAALAKQVFRIPLSTMHLFRDIDSGAFSLVSHSTHRSPTLLLSFSSDRFQQRWCPVL
jgi:hypothetical protein